MSARDRILSRLRRGLEAAPRTEGAVEDRLASAGTQLSPVPALGRKQGAEALAQFEQKLRAVDCTVTRLTWDALPQSLAEELRARNLPRAIRMGEDPELNAVDWSGMDVSHGTGRIEEPATLSRATAGVAETGTVALRSGPDNPVTLTFLAETHFIVVKTSDVVPGLDDMWARIRAAGEKPRTVNLVTGPSRSADIGQVLQLGAHGPVAVHVFIVED